MPLSPSPSCHVTAAPPTAVQRRVEVAAASDLKFAMDELVGEFRKAQLGCAVSVSYGSSGLFLFKPFPASTVSASGFARSCMPLFRKV
jgi:hypothetical protein